MGMLKIPSNGLSISYSAQPTKEKFNEPPQTIRIDLPESVANDIFQSLQKNERVRLRAGKIPTIQIAQKTLAFEALPESFPSEVFAPATKTIGQLYFSGNLSHVLEIQKAQEDTAKADKALTALENTLKSLQEQRSSNETSFVRGKEELKPGLKKDVRASPALGHSPAIRKDRFLGGLPRSTPSSPFLSASYSPKPGPTSAPSSNENGNTSKEKLRLDAIKIPVLHLLAAEPMTVDALAKKIRASRDDCEKVLMKVARDSKDGVEKELKEKSYRELDVWKFPYQRQQNRQAAIDRAIHAFDRMRIEKSDLLWQMLLPYDDRGKGKSLSRLNFDKPVPVQPLPKPDVRSGDESQEHKASVSDQEIAQPKSKKPEHGKPPQDKLLSKPRPSQHGEERSKSQSRPVSSKQIKPPTSSQPRNKSVKQEGRFKSSERIEDSDEEAEGVEVIVDEPRIPAKRKDPPTDVSSQSLKKPSHKQQSSSSSSENFTDNKNGNINGSSSKPNKSQLGTNKKTHASARSRQDSSPPKPSPLGFSPPTNTTDMDNSSSGKASSQSSAPSSPPSSTDVPLAKTRHRYSPVIAQPNQSLSRGRSPTKRKPDFHDEHPPAKRQQVNGIHSSVMTNDLNENSERPSLHRKVTDMEKSTSPEKQIPHREDVIDEAKRFQKYYQKYKDLHERITQIPEKDRDDREMQDLWKMHKRLAEMKNEIWHNWSQVEKAEVQVN